MTYLAVILGEPEFLIVSEFLIKNLDSEAYPHSFKVPLGFAFHGTVNFKEIENT